MNRTYISRPTYIKQIEPYIGKSIIKVLVGQRRVGKSFLMYEIMAKIEAAKEQVNIIYIDKEKYEFDAIKNYADLITYIDSHKKQGRNALFIDEIQDIEGFEKALRSLNTEKDFDIFITGSNANLLSGELATFLSGRYIEIPVYSLSYSEFLTFHKKEDSASSFQLYLKYGGLPFLINLPLEDDIIYDYLKNISDTIIYKDVVRRFGVRNVVFLENLVEYLADNIGSLVSSKKISDFLKSQKINISTNMVIEYLSHLTNAHLIQQVKRKDIAGKKVFEIGEKFYFQDLGIRNSLRGYNAVRDYGKLLENVVYSHLRSKGYNVKIGKLANLEIDFVAERQNEVLYIQVCYLLSEQSTIDREFGNLLKINDQYPKMVLSMDEAFQEGNYEGVLHKTVREYLSY